MADDEKKEHQKKEDESSSYSLTVSVVQSKLNLSLYNKTTKNVYQTGFTSEELTKCGYSKKQSSNLEAVSKFISSAKKGDDNLKFSISIEQNDDKKSVVNDTDNDAEGVHGVNVSETTAKPAKADNAKNEEVAVIKISKEDNFFGEMQFIMKLKKMPRQQSDINLDYINDLKEENVALKQEINTLKEQLNAVQQQQTTVAIAEWKSTKRESDNKPVLWNVVALEPTIKGMAKSVDIGRYIEIGIGGLYRIDVRCQYTSTCTSASSKFSLKNNNDIIAEFKAVGETFIRGTMSEIVDLKKDDKLSVWCTCGHAMDPLYNHFILQKIA